MFIQRAFFGEVPTPASRGEMSFSSAIVKSGSPVA
jgi:hypothetical protein